MSVIENKRARPRTECFDCAGLGKIVVDNHAVWRGICARAMTVRRCPTCRGLRWLPGFVIPT